MIYLIEIYGLKDNIEQFRQRYIDRLNFELDVIKNSGYASYFLVTADFIQWAKDHDIPIVRYLWLARTLYSACTVGQTIPRETIQSAASLFKVIKQLQTEEAKEQLEGHFENDIYQMD